MRNYCARMLLVMLTLAGWSVQVARAQHAAPPPPGKLAVLNIVDLFDRLDEKKAIDGQIESMKRELSDKIEKKKADLEKAQKELEAAGKMFKPDSAEIKKQQDELVNRSMELQILTQVSQKQLLIELNTQKVHLYRKINDAIADYARANGIAMVFAEDDPPVAEGQTAEGLQAIISLRKVLYADARFDITRAIVEKMNKDYLLGAK